MRYQTLKQYRESGAVTGPQNTDVIPGPPPKAKPEDMPEFKALLDKLTREISDAVDGFGHHLTDVINKAKVLPAQGGQAQAVQKITKNLPWFKHGVKGFLNKLWWGDHPGNPMWHNVESANLTLSKLCLIEDYIERELNVLFLTETTSPFPGWQRYDDVIRQAVEEFKIHLVKKIKGYVTDGFAIASKWHNDSIKPADVAPSKKDDPTPPAPEAGPGPTPAAPAPEPEVVAPADDTEKDEPVISTKEDVPTRTKPLFSTGPSSGKPLPAPDGSTDGDVSSINAPPTLDAKIQAAKEGLTKSAWTPKEAGKAHRKFIEETGLSMNSHFVKEQLAGIKDPDKREVEREKMSDKLMKTWDHIHSLFDSGKEKIKEGSLQDAIKVMEDYQLDPSDPKDVRKIWPDHEEVPLVSKEEYYKKTESYTPMQRQINEFRYCLAQGLS